MKLVVYKIEDEKEIKGFGTVKVENDEEFNIDSLLRLDKKQYNLNHLIVLWNEHYCDRVLDYYSLRMLVEPMLVVHDITPDNLVASGKFESKMHKIAFCVVKALSDEGLSINEIENYVMLYLMNHFDKSKTGSANLIMNNRLNNKHLKASLVNSFYFQSNFFSKKFENKFLVKINKTIKSYC